MIEPNIECAIVLFKAARSRSTFSKVLLRNDSCPQAFLGSVTNLPKAFPQILQIRPMKIALRTRKTDRRITPRGVVATTASVTTATIFITTATVASPFITRLALQESVRCRAICR